ncbi:MAG: pyridoxal phosphate-dependent aminotransferase [Sphingobacteriia bacterium]|nr:pyridoxal phosphate-dependent aminotransferase [Sphingobacteriia bacterium]
MNEFDIINNRKNTDSMKWDLHQNNAIPMWVADMDFKCPQVIFDELTKVISHGILGYPLISDNYYKSVRNWFSNNHNMQLEINNIIPTTGVLPSLRTIVEEFTFKDDNIIIQTPVYYMFEEIIKDSDRKVLYNPLIYNEDGSYNINFHHLNELLKYKPKIFILCSPHNPVGRIWQKEELVKIINYCNKNGILLIADEIHCDLIAPGFKFHSLGSFSKEMLNNIIILNSPTKTFNLAGLRGGNAFIFNEEIRARFKKRLNLHGANKLNTFYIKATEIAYSQAAPWLTSLNNYLKNNYLYIQDFINKNLPQIKLTPLEATYLVWMNYENLKISEDQLISKLEKDVIFSPGSKFGENGKGFIRLNIATPLEVIKKALILLKEKTL